jgi:hypothetical protein
MWHQILIWPNVIDGGDLHLLVHGIHFVSDKKYDRLVHSCTRNIQPVVLKLCSVECPESAATFPNDELQFFRILAEIALIVTYNTVANNEFYF